MRDDDIDDEQPEAEESACLHCDLWGAIRDHLNDEEGITYDSLKIVISSLARVLADILPDQSDEEYASIIGYFNQSLIAALEEDATDDPSPLGERVAVSEEDSFPAMISTMVH